MRASENGIGSSQHTVYDLVYNGSTIKMKVIKMQCFYHVLNNIDFPMKVKFIGSNSVSACVCVAGYTVM
jgi:hypothetical protein